MPIVENTKRTHSSPTCVAVGVFDGVHCGHQAVLRKAVRDAAQSGALAVALTFDPHPDQVVRPPQAPRLLTTVAERAELMAALGVEAVVVAHFDRAFADLTPEQFARDLLVGQLGARCVVAGRGFRFGRAGRGSIDTLRELGTRLGFSADAVAQVEVGGRAVSSTLVREIVAGGEMAAATTLLGHHYTIGGRVIRGDQRGRTLGAATANLEVEERKLLPPHGVYATRVRIDGDDAVLPAVTNIGVRPTFKEAGAPSIEAHIIAPPPPSDLYGRQITLDVVSRLREERVFANAAALARQIQRDIAEARKALARA